MPPQPIADDPAQNGFTDQTVTCSVDAKGELWLPESVFPQPECTARVVPVGWWYLLVACW